MLEIGFVNDLAYFVSPTAKAIGCENDVKSDLSGYTGQRRNFYGFLLVKSRENVIEEKIQRVLQEFAGCYSKQSPYILVDRVVTLLCAVFGKVSKSRTALQYIHFNRVEQSVEIAHDFDFDGLVIVGGVDSKTNAHLYAANLSSKPQSTTVALAAKLKLVIFLLVS
ncbi:hypothetical protein MTR67_028018 [Solanum verrucosum]|uniref:Uncharacterized protein n=1 Tax=Solanum verrucosum TaxID=315347 RepID=A0AAF0R4S4_SOLVR|nr:hypothetical protein MTR67_028018 [Solanum verrucosum]